jgi:hypothetical protein
MRAIVIDAAGLGNRFSAAPHLPSPHPDRPQPGAKSGAEAPMARRPTASPGAALAPLAGVSLLLLAACGNTAPTAVGSVKPHSSGSTAPATTAQPQSPSPSASAPAGNPTSCPLKTLALTAQPGDQPAPVCLHPGDTLTITAQDSPLQPWQPAISTNPAALSCTSRPQAGGALTIVCHALHPGDVTVSTTTAPFSGDPHGPAQYTWTLTVRILPEV